MGLDITALRRATFLDPQPDDDDGYDRFHCAWLNPDFAERADGLRSGFYAADDSLGFRAGSYSGYNRWREWLSAVVLGVTPEEVWQNPEAFAGRPFVELIHFADNEGIIGPQTSAKLARDFAEHTERVATVSDVDYYLETYANFRAAFDMAADGGLVQFH